ncbi:MAG: sugar ABC transporter ATP-binding protein [Anaerolineaceae bacterium]|nr:sugar ABC transporter ATP-binding protein [Anaerolineaceae bacterium]
MNLNMNHIYKSFGANNVLTDVDFELEGGEICALLGENGAGKSTLMNILGGVLPADSGMIQIDGKEVHFESPVDSLDAGIGFIHQELNLINDLTIYENMFITHLPQKGMFLDKAQMIQKTSELFERMGVQLNPMEMVRDLDASYKQIVEICRALLQEASIIIMDEPTTSLTEPEIRRVFAMMRTLKDQGVGIIFISHKLNEVMEICDRFTVLRDGNMVAAGRVCDTDTRKLAAYMVGHEVATEVNCRSGEYGKEVLKLEKLGNGQNFRNISLCVHAGEVLGVTGLLGDGRSELFLTVFGAMGSHYSGHIFLEGTEIRVKNTHEALERGIAYLPRNRKENAILKDMTILDNGSIVYLPKIVKGIFIDRKKQEELFQNQVEALRIKMGDRYDLITSLSGGNQQKVVLAKWLMSGPKVLILDNPTQGVDVGAKEEIYQIIHRLADMGVAVIVLSSEAQEIIRVCDRSWVMFHGEQVGMIEGEDEMTEHNIMFLATGGLKHETENAA